MLSYSYLRSCTLLAILITITLTSSAIAEIDVIRREIEPRVKARVKHGRNVGIEVHPPAGQAAQAFLRRYLAMGRSREWCRHVASRRFSWVPRWSCQALLCGVDNFAS